MNVLILGDSASKPGCTWLSKLSKDNDYTVYTLDYGNYINYYDILIHLKEEDIINKYEHIIVQGANSPDLVFYTWVWKEHLWKLERENFTFYYCNYGIENDLLWASGIFKTAIGDNIQKRWDMNLKDEQINYLERFVDNNAIDTIMKGSEIRLLRLLESIKIPYKLIKDIKNENIDIWTAG